MKDVMRLLIPTNDEVNSSIYEWPAHGDVSLNQDFFLAPFYDNEMMEV